MLRELVINLGTKTVVFSGAEIPLSPATSISDLTAPACRPQVGVAKRVFSGPTAHGAGTFSATFEIAIEALGDFPLWDLQVTDDLTTEFGTLVTGTPDAPGEYAVTSAPAITAENPGGPPPNSDLTANPAFNGNNYQDLFVLTPGDSVEVAATVTLRFTIRFYPAIGKTVYENQGVAEGDSREDHTTDGDTDDDSDDGIDPDPDGDGTYTVTYTLLVESLCNVPLYDIRVDDDLTADFGTNVEPWTPDAPAALRRWRQPDPGLGAPRDRAALVFDRPARVGSAADSGVNEYSASREGAVLI